MRIIVVSDLPQFVTGGAEMQAARLIEAWMDAGHEVLCFGRRMGKSQVTLGRHSVAVERIRTTSLFGRLGRAASYALSLAWLLLKHRHWTDVIYTRFLGEAAATAALLKSLGWLSAPIVATPANTRGRGDIDFLLAVPFARSIIGLLDRQCDAINLIAAEMTGELREAGFSGGNFTCIPNGITLRPLRERRGSSVRLIAVGRLAPQKGYDILLHALAAISQRLEPRQVLIVGDGPERERLQSLAKALGLEGEIVWAGEYGQTAVAHALEDARLFLLPSRYEGMSNAGLEAMERGLPMVLTRCGGLDRYIDADMGWVVPPDDVAALAQAISAALDTNPEELAQMGSLCRERVAREFDIAVTAGRYCRLFQELRDDDNVTDRFRA